MQELIKITENENGIKTISARGLFEYLEVKTAFRHWIDRMFEYGFENGKDYTPFIFEHPQNKQETTDYALTMDTAKEISMLQRTEKGKTARLYFIEQDKVAKGKVHIMDEEQFAEHHLQVVREKKALLLELKEVKAEKENLEAVTDLQKQQLQIAAPKVKYVDEVLKSESAHTTTVIAKELGMSAVSLNATLHNKGVIFRQNDTWVLYSKYQDKGYTKTNTFSYTDSYGLTRTSINTVWTEKGRAFIHDVVHKQAKTA